MESDIQPKIIANVTRAIGVVYNICSVFKITRRVMTPLKTIIAKRPSNNTNNTSMIMYLT